MYVTMGTYPTPGAYKSALNGITPLSNNINYLLKSRVSTNSYTCDVMDTISIHITYRDNVTYIPALYTFPTHPDYYDNKHRNNQKLYTT